MKYRNGRREIPSFEQALNSPKFSQRSLGLTTFLFAEASR
jgi:hypothetical protein